MKPKQFANKLKQIQARFEDQFNEVIRVAKSPQFLDPIAVIAADLIRKRTRLGYSVAREGADRQKLAGLSEKYIEFRKKSRLSQFTTPRRSNLTFSGQLLDSIKGRSTPRGIVVYLENQRSDPGKKKVTNAQIKDYQEKQGRPFFYLSRTEIINIERVYRQKVFNELKSRRILVR